MLATAPVQHARLPYAAHAVAQRPRRSRSRGATSNKKNSVVNVTKAKGWKQRTRVQGSADARSEVPAKLDVKLYGLLRDDQLEILARLTREIMKNKASEYNIERITKNSVLRALIDHLKELELDVRDVPDEGELTKRISDAIRTK
jgi:hypothetical protein